MKIRIKDNTIRYRFDKMDIENLNNSGICEEILTADNFKMRYTVKKCEKVPSSVNIFPFSLEIIINEEEISALLDGSDDGIQLLFPNTNGKSLRVSLERDFKCLVPRGEDDRYGFDHPQEGKPAC